MRLLAGMMIFGAVVGCGGGAAEVVAIDKVPDAMLKAAQKELPEVTFDNAIKHSDGSYEVRGKDPKGKVRDVEFSATGEITEIE